MPLLRVICWAIIFLTRIRFPPDVSIADVILHTYNKNTLFLMKASYGGKLLPKQAYLVRCGFHYVVIV